MSAGSQQSGTGCRLNPVARGTKLPPTHDPRPTTLVLCALAALACNAPDQVIRQDPPVCGEWTTAKFTTDSSSGVFGAASGFATGVAGGVRFYSWVYQVQNLCLSTPHPDNAVQFVADFRSGTPQGVSVVGYVYLSDANPGDATQVDLTRRGGSSRVEFTGMLHDIDYLSSSADGKSGTILAELDVSFPTTGSAATDLAQLRSQLLGLRIETFFHRYLGE